MFKMKRDDKILFGAIVIVLLLFFVVGFNFDGFTGSVVRDSGTKIIISPKVVSNGEIIQISVSPSSKGVNVKTSFYQAEDDLRKISVNKLCNSYKCSKDGSFSFVIPNSWESGVYYVKVYDYGLKDFVIEDFTVKN